MALIRCPKCGGTVSDSAVKCVHCGENLSAIRRQEDVSREYSTLEVEEKTRIREEYDRIYPNFKLKENKENKFSNVCIVLGAICLILFLLLGVFGGIAIANTGTPISLTSIIFLVLLLICGIVLAVFFFFWRDSEKQILYEQKKFAAWLKKEKGLTYNIILDKEDREEYDSFKVN